MSDDTYPIKQYRAGVKARQEKKDSSDASAVKIAQDSQKSDMTATKNNHEIFSSLRDTSDGKGADGVQHPDLKAKADSIQKVYSRDSTKLAADERGDSAYTTIFNDALSKSTERDNLDKANRDLAKSRVPKVMPDATRVVRNKSK